MTFHVGQLVVCVDASREPKRFCPQHLLSLCEFLVKGRIYRVSAVNPIDLRLEGDPIPPGYRGGYDQSRFRPLNDTEDDAELIALIKSAKPQSIPAEPCLTSHAGLLGSAAGDTHVSGGTLPTAWAEAREDSGKDFTNSNSHGEAF